MADKRIPELPQKGVNSNQGPIAIYDPFLDKTVQIKVQEALGAIRADMDWQVDVTYNTDDYVLYLGLTAWKSLVDNNTGRVPAENSFWTQVDISQADGITDTQWAPGLFTYNNSKVVYQSQAYYLQTAAPFESSDIAAEIIAGDWATSLVSPASIFNPTGGNVNYIEISGQLICELEDVAGDYILPLISSLSDIGYIVNIKNVSGSTVTVSASGADTIEGDTTIELIDSENLTLYMVTGEYKLL